VASQARRIAVGAIAALLFVGCGERSLPHRVGARPSASEAVHYAERLLALCADEGNIPAKRECIDGLAGLGEDCLPGLERMLQGRLAGTPESTQRRLAWAIHMAIARITCPTVPWAPDVFALAEDFSLAKAVRRPWLAPFLLKVFKHHLIRDRSGALWALSWHSADSVQPLTHAVRDGDPHIRRCAFDFLRQLSLPPRNDDTVSRAVCYAIRWDQDALVRASAILAAIDLKTESAVPTLLSILDDDCSLEMAAGSVDASVVWGESRQPVARPDEGFAPTIGQLAAHAVQEITGTDFGFTNCYDARDRMPEIVRTMRKELVGKYHSPTPRSL